MKIALFHNLPPGGAKRALFEHARHLAQRGHSLEAYTLSTADEGYLPLAPLCRNLFCYDAPTFERAHPLPAPLRKVAGGRAGQVIGSALETRRQIRGMDAWEAVYAKMAADIDGRGYDLVYVHQCRFLLAPPLLRLLKTPCVYFCQDTLRHVQEWPLETHPEFDSSRRLFGRRRMRGHVVPFYTEQIWREQERRDTANARAATRVLANSWYSREAILRAYGVNAHLCYLGVDSAFFCPDPHVARGNTVLSVGSLTKAKCHDFIVEAVATIPESRRPSVRIVGYDPSPNRDHAGSMADSLRRLAQSRGVSLEISQEISDEALREEYRNARVVAFAPHLEPFGFVALEAMACATPVVGVSEAGLRESIQDGVTGLLTNRDHKEFGSAVHRLLNDEALAAELGENGRRIVQSKWHWKRSVDVLEDLFRQAVESTSP